MELWASYTGTFSDRPAAPAIDDDDRYFLIMPHMTLGNLDKYLAFKEYHLPWGLVYKIAGDILRGLKYLHQHDRNLIHRDLTPQNILLTHDPNWPTVKISGNTFINFYD